MRIYCYTPTKDDAASAYRGFGVMSELNKSGNFRCEYWDDFELLKAKGFGALFMQRPDRREQCEALMAAKMMNMPVVIDYDDDLLNVPPHNKNYYQQMNKHFPDYKEHIKFCLTQADHVIVSTDALKKQFSQYNQNITVIRNAFDDHIYTSQGFNKTKTVVWRGGCSHTQDLETYRDDLTALMVNNQDFHFVFIGSGFPTWLLECKCKNLNLVDPVYTYDFFNELKYMKPSLMLVPLEDTPFNRCKSDCAKLEGIMAGAVTLTPDWDEWKWLGFNYKDSLYKSANGILNRIRNFDPKLISQHQEMRNHIRAYRCLSLVNSQRAEVFNGLDAAQQ